MNLYNQKGTIKANNESPNIFYIEKKTPWNAFPTMLSIGKNIDYNFESLKNNPVHPKKLASNNFIKDLEKYAHSMGVMSIGYANVVPELIFKDKAVLFGNAIVLTKEIDKNDVENNLPGKTATDLKIYDKLGKITNEIADYLRENGFGAHASHPAVGSVAYPALAQNACLGWKGKNNLLITPELGPRQKISAIFASIDNLPFNKDNKHSQISDYCDICGKCIKKCPKGAISEFETQKGYKTSKLTPELCKGCYESCTICMSECPFNKKGYEFVKNKFEKYNKKI